MSIRVSICDDDVDEVAKLKNIVEDYLQMQGIAYDMKTYHSPDMLLHEYEMQDILFLDIEMPEYDGLTVAGEIRKKDEDVRIVFLTSHREYIQKAFVVRAYRYLYKPYQRTEIHEVLEDATKEL